MPLVRLDSGAHLFGVRQLTAAVAIAGITPGPENTGVRINQAPIANAEDIGFTSHIAYDFGKVTLLAITGIDQYRLHDLTDWDTTDADTLQYFTPFTNTQPAGSNPGSGPPLHGGVDLPEPGRNGLRPGAAQGLFPLFRPEGCLFEQLKRGTGGQGLA